MKKVDIGSVIVGTIVSLAIVYSYAFVAGKGWKKSQE